MDQPKVLHSLDTLLQVAELCHFVGNSLQFVGAYERIHEPTNLVESRGKHIPAIRGTSQHDDVPVTLL